MGTETARVGKATRRNCCGYREPCTSATAIFLRMSPRTVTGGFARVIRRGITWTRGPGELQASTTAAHLRGTSIDSSTALRHRNANGPACPSVQGRYMRRPDVPDTGAAAGVLKEILAVKGFQLHHFIAKMHLGRAAGSCQNAR